MNEQRASFKTLSRYPWAESPGLNPWFSKGSLLSGCHPVPTRCHTVRLGLPAAGAPSQTRVSPSPSLSPDWVLGTQTSDDPPDLRPTFSASCWAFGGIKWDDLCRKYFRAYKIKFHLIFLVPVRRENLKVQIVGIRKW